MHISFQKNIHTGTTNWTGLTHFYALGQRFPTCGARNLGKDQWGYAEDKLGYAKDQWGYAKDQWGYAKDQWGYAKDQWVRGGPVGRELKVGNGGHKKT
ncbi:hypothetical protein AVEN_1267-1 [Araneus ventricosus]|uniref:Uncharacterized protein n=1 Tax=Araneus ventricosus TaxID=182803 RepID=A0A4Y2WN85_ARAVE|nr:hypothetical protein AVEN_1267-1 [Araneus ventricosus]